MGDKRLLERLAKIERIRLAGSRVWALGEFVDADFPEPDFLIDGLILDLMTHNWNGAPGSGKTWLAIEAALAIAGGRPFLGHFKTGEPRRVLIIDQESHPGGIAERLRQLLKDDPTATIARKNIGIVVTSGLNVDSDFDNPASGYNTIRGFISEFGPDIIFFDSFTRLHKANENDAGDMADVFERIGTLRNEFGCAIVLLDHTTKGIPENAAANPGVRLRGSGEKLAGVDAAMLITREDDIITCNPDSKTRWIKTPPSFTASLVQTEHDGLALRYGAEKQKEAATTARDIMLAIHALEAQLNVQGVTVTEISGYLELTPQTVNKHCTKLLKSDLIMSIVRPAGHKGGRPATAYTIPREPDAKTPDHAPLIGVLKQFQNGSEGASEPEQGAREVLKVLNPPLKGIQYSKPPPVALRNDNGGS